jgi:serine O-acetyltransferase
MRNISIVDKIIRLHSLLSNMSLRSLAVSVYFDITLKLMKHFCCDIRRRLPESTTLPHPTGIVIAGGCKIGKDVRIGQNVTLGKRSGEGYPEIKDNVKIYANAVIVGDITIGRNSIVGAHATVIDDVPPESTVVGTPAKPI